MYIYVHVHVYIYTDIYIYIYLAIRRLTQMIFKHNTNELRNYSLTTHNNKTFLFAALNIWFVLGAAKLVVFRLVSFGDAIA